MISLFKAEFYKLRKHKTFSMLISITMLQGILVPLLNEPTVGVDTFMKMYQGQEYFTLMLFFATLAATFIAYDFEQGVFKHPIAFGHSIGHIVLTKFATFLIGCCALSFIVPSLAVAISSIRHGFGPGTTELVVGLSTSQVITKLLSIALLMTLVYMGIASIAAAIAFVTRNAVITLAAFAGIDLLRRIVTIVAVRNENVAALVKNTIFFQSNAILYDAIDTSLYVKVIIVSAITIGFAMLLSSMFLKRFDLR